MGSGRQSVWLLVKPAPCLNLLTVEYADGPPGSCYRPRDRQRRATGRSVDIPQHEGIEENPVGEVPGPARVVSAEEQPDPGVDPRGLAGLPAEA